MPPKAQDGSSGPWRSGLKSPLILAAVRKDARPAALLSLFELRGHASANPTGCNGSRRRGAFDRLRLSEVGWLGPDRRAGQRLRLGGDG